MEKEYNGYVKWSMFITVVMILLGAQGFSYKTVYDLSNQVSTATARLEERKIEYDRLQEDIRLLREDLKEANREVRNLYRELQKLQKDN